MIYIHRCASNAAGVICSGYLHGIQKSIEKAPQNAEYIIATTVSVTDKERVTRARYKYVKQLSETRVYYQALSNIALQKSELDLNDGVKVNYTKFQGVEISNEGTKRQTIDLLAKI